MILPNRSPGSNDGGERFMMSSMKLDQHKKDFLGARFKKQNTSATNNNNVEKL